MHRKGQQTTDRKNSSAFVRHKTSLARFLEQLEGNVLVQQRLSLFYLILFSLESYQYTSTEPRLLQTLILICNGNGKFCIFCDDQYSFPRRLYACSTDLPTEPTVISHHSRPWLAANLIGTLTQSRSCLSSRSLQRTGKTKYGALM
jgi:hypothetical protein